jgi:hypothetical protein
MTFALLGILALHSGGALLAFSRPFRTAPFRTAPGRATGTKLLVLSTGEAPDLGLASGRLRPS